MEASTRTDITTQNSSVHNTGPNPYDLPDGKEYHIFIACSGEDSAKGRWVMEQLESRYPFRCVYHERDFRPGVMILENMREFIDKSVKILLLISKGFQQSQYCKLEETFAISLSNDSLQNCIIPVLLEDVPLSHLLRHMTYINATLPGDIVVQIRDAFCRTACQIELSPKLRDTVEGADNGKRIGIIKGHFGRSCYCGCQWKMKAFNLNIADLDEDTWDYASYKIDLIRYFRMLWQYITFKHLISEMYDEAKYTLDSNFAIRCYSFLTLGDGSLRLFIACIVYCMLVLVVQLSSTRSLEKTFDKWNIYNVIKEWTTSVLFYYSLVVYVIGSRLSRIYISAIMWKILKRHYKKSKCLIFNDYMAVGIINTWVGRKILPTLVMIRYDTNPCKEYILIKLRNAFPLFAGDHEFFEKWADNLIEFTIEHFSKDIVHWENLPKSIYNRHSTWQQRECICQLVEPYLNDLKFGQYNWVKSLTKRRHRACPKIVFKCLQSQKSKLCEYINV